MHFLPVILDPDERVETLVERALAPSAAVATVVSAGGSDAPPPSLSSDAHH